VGRVVKGREVKGREGSEMKGRRKGAMGEKGREGKG
jgi:hypothetical protein